MARSRKFWVFILIVIVVFQFIQPTKNIAESPDTEGIDKVYTLPEGVQKIFREKCFDCHSNTTRYPWYFNIQPIGWWLAAHIHEGKQELNFSEFKRYPQDKAKHKLEEILEMVEQREMPLKAYVLLHPHTEITEDDEAAVRKWVSGLVPPKH